jgi:hypothetical protein
VFTGVFSFPGIGVLTASRVIGAERMRRAAEDDDDANTVSKI